METVNFLKNFLVEFFTFCIFASRAATSLFITFQINTLQDVLGDYEISVHLTNTAKYSRFFDFTRLGEFRI